MTDQLQPFIATSTTGDGIRRELISPIGPGQEAERSVRTVHER